MGRVQKEHLVVDPGDTLVDRDFCCLVTGLAGSADALGRRLRGFKVFSCFDGPSRIAQFRDKGLQLFRQTFYPLVARQPIR